MLPAQVRWCWRTRSQLPAIAWGGNWQQQLQQGKLTARKNIWPTLCKDLWSQKFWWGLGARLLCPSFSPPFFLWLVWKSTNTLTVPLCGLCQYMDVHRWRSIFLIYLFSWGMWDLVSWSGIQLRPPTLGATNLSHSTWHPAWNGCAC